MEYKEVLVFQDVAHQNKRQNGKGWKIDESYTLDKMNTQAVLVIPKSTNTQSKFTKNTSQNTKDMVMQKQLRLENFQTLTSWWRGFRVKHLVSLESVKDFKTLEARSFLRSLGFLKTKDPDIFCLKMLKVCLVTNQAKLSRQYLKFSPTLGMYYSGKFSIVRTTESHRIGKECSLSDILEDNVDPKYFLSEKAMKRLVYKLKE